MYVAEIIPPAASAVEAFESKYVEEGKDNKAFIVTENGKNDIEFGMLRGHIQRACFEGLKKEIDYSVKVSTVVNGKTISEVCEDIEEEHEDIPEETEEHRRQTASLATATASLNHYRHHRRDTGPRATRIVAEGQ